MAASQTLEIQGEFQQRPPVGLVAWTEVPRYGQSVTHVSEHLLPLYPVQTPARGESSSRNLNGPRQHLTGRYNCWLLPAGSRIDTIFELTDTRRAAEVAPIRGPEPAGIA